MSDQQSNQEELILLLKNNSIYNKETDSRILLDYDGLVEKYKLYDSSITRSDDKIEELMDTLKQERFIASRTQDALVLDEKGMTDKNIFKMLIDFAVQKMKGRVEVDFGAYKMAIVKIYTFAVSIEFIFGVGQKIGISRPRAISQLIKLTCGAEDNNQVTNIIYLLYKEYRTFLYNEVRVVRDSEILNVVFESAFLW